VEYVHRLHQLEVARREMAAELDENQQVNQFNAVQMHSMRAELDKNMSLLLASRASHARPAAKLDYTWEGKRPRDGAWQAVKQNGALDLMPHAELQNYAHLYAVMGSFMEAVTALDMQMDAAGAIARRSPDGILSPRDIDELITATSDAQGKLAFTEILMQFEEKSLTLAR
jgi:hypothetical protein